MNAFTLVEMQYKRENVPMKKQYIMELFRLCGKTMSNSLFEKWRKKNDGMFEY